MCERKEQLVGYLYGELEADEDKAFDAHLTVCGECRAELAGLRSTRTHLASWAPPEPDLGLRIVRAAAAPPPPPRTRALPAWGLAAAAALVLAASAALANLEIRVGSDGLTVRTGWARAAEPQSGPVRQTATTEAPAEPDQWRADLARIEARLNEIEHDLVIQPGGQVQAAAAGAGMSDAEMIRRVREMVSQSETRQQREIMARVSQVIREFDRQRRNDLALIQQGMGQYHGLTNAEIAQQRDMLNHLVRVTTTRQER